MNTEQRKFKKVVKARKRHASKVRQKNEKKLAQDKKIKRIREGLRNGTLKIGNKKVGAKKPSLLSKIFKPSV